ncbi:hypothetical protein MTR_3g014770 [Medicago truncatula]|uniref:Uncharacterized protein n=1 Tax=Medicago truncatula TaxID=3880 RepID=G7J0L9_MEDTR|nr:hypothetical protein MTR_3g014770 [Medicago truncatula]
MNENKRKRDGGVGPQIKTQMPRTNKLVDINRKLSDAQRSRIMKTPFRYLVEMKTYIGMNGTLLKELLHRWDASSLGFRVGVRIVAFKHLDLY